MARNNTIIYSFRADNDFINIIDYHKTLGSITRVRKIITAIEKKIDTLKDFAPLGTFDIDYKKHYLTAENYKIYYTYDETNKLVMIHTIRHTSQEHLKA